jgi:hypothetical protein
MDSYFELVCCAAGLIAALALAVLVCVGLIVWFSGTRARPTK